jgi:hypothetical protein
LGVTEMCAFSLRCLVGPSGSMKATPRSTDEKSSANSDFQKEIVEIARMTALAKSILPRPTRPRSFPGSADHSPAVGAVRARRPLLCPGPDRCETSAGHGAGFPSIGWRRYAREESAFARASHLS